MKKNKENSGFLITCVACVLLFMFMCYFGVNSSSLLKVTKAEETTSGGCPSSAPNNVGEYCCPTGYTSMVKTIGGTTYCIGASSNSLTLKNGTLVCDIMVSNVESIQSYINDGWDCDPYYQDTSLGVFDSYFCTKSNEEVGCAVEATVLSESGGSSNLGDKVCQFLNGEYNWLTLVGGVASGVTGAIVDNMFCEEVSNAKQVELSVNLIYKNGTTESKSCTTPFNKPCDVTLPDDSVSEWVGWNTSKDCKGATYTDSYRLYYHNANGEINNGTTLYSCTEEDSSGSLTGMHTVKFWRGTTLLDTETCAFDAIEQCQPGAIKPPSSCATWSPYKDCRIKFNSNYFLNSYTANGDANYYCCDGVESSSGDNGGGYIPSNPSSSDVSSSEISPESSSKENASDNPDTGEIAIAITWFMGLFAIAYSVYYFKKVKEN